MEVRVSDHFCFLLNVTLTRTVLPNRHPICMTIGMLQDSGLVLRKGFRASQDADGMALLRAASAIPPALTNISDLCMWWESYNNLHGRTNNPIRQSPHLWQIQWSVRAFAHAAARLFCYGSISCCLQLSQTGR